MSVGSLEFSTNTKVSLEEEAFDISCLENTYSSSIHILFLILMTERCTKSKTKANMTKDHMHWFVLTKCCNMLRKVFLPLLRYFKHGSELKATMPHHI